MGDVGEGEAEEWQTGYAMHMLESGNPPYDVLLLLGDNVYPSGDPSRLDATVFHPFGILLEKERSSWRSSAITTRRMALSRSTTSACRAVGGRRRSTMFAHRARLEQPDRSGSARVPPTHAQRRDRAVARLRRSTSRRIHPGIKDRTSPSARPTRRCSRGTASSWVSGHDHDYQRSTPVDGVTYVIFGAGGRTRGTGEDWFTAASWSVLSYVDLNVFPDHLLLRAIDQDGRMFDQVRIDR